MRLIFIITFILISNENNFFITKGCCTLIEGKKMKKTSCELGKETISVDFFDIQKVDGVFQSQISLHGRLLNQTSSFLLIIGETKDCELYNRISIKDTILENFKYQDTINIELKKNEILLLTDNLTNETRWYGLR